MDILATSGNVLCFVGIVVFVGLFIIWSAIKIVPEYQRLVVFRLGRVLQQPKGPGIVFIFPGIDTVKWVDLREQIREVPHQVSITKDNAPISIDFLWYYKILDPAMSVLQVGNFELSAAGIAATTLRAVIGGIPLDDVLSEREHINNMLRTRLDEVTERWGVKVTSVEIREILPPREVQTAMNLQLAAERERRAMVTQSEGKREATIKIAEGDKQAAILRAEGDRQSSILRAEGFSLALDTIYRVAQTVDNKTMSLQYLDMLKVLGAGPSTKFVLPMEFTNLLRPFIGHTTEAADGHGDAGTRTG